MLTWQFVATGTKQSVNSAKRALNLSKKGSLHVVPSGHTTKSPCLRSFLIVLASLSLSLDNLTVGMGEMISDKRDKEKVTAVIGRLMAIDTNTGSIKVLCVHTKSTPFLLFTLDGGVPFTISLTPKHLNTSFDMLTGSKEHASIRKNDSGIPNGSQRRIKRAEVGVGLLANRPSWKING